MSRNHSDCCLRKLIVYLFLISYIVFQAFVFSLMKVSKCWAINKRFIRPIEWECAQCTAAHCALLLSRYAMYKLVSNLYVSLFVVCICRLMFESRNKYASFAVHNLRTWFILEHAFMMRKISHTWHSGRRFHARLLNNQRWFSSVVFALFSLWIRFYLCSFYWFVECAIISPFII